MDDFSDSVPCSSLAVDSVLRMSFAGVIWGSCCGSFDAKSLGLSGSAHAAYTAKLAGKYGFYCGLFGAIFSFANCGIQRYRQRKDWVNTLAAGVVAGAAFGVGTRNWKQFAATTGLFCLKISQHAFGPKGLVPIGVSISIWSDQETPGVG